MRGVRAVGIRVASAAVVASMFVATASVASAVSPTDDPAPKQTYVIQTTPDGVDKAATALAALGTAPVTTYTHALDGMSADLTVAQADALATMPQVSSVTVEHAFSMTDTESPVTWGLDRIDQATLPLDDSYTYPSSAGAGVPVYVVDTGVSPDPTLGTRLMSGDDEVKDGYGTTDCEGHGTHVAGTVASTVWGVAKAAMIVPVRVLDCTGWGTTTTVIAGLDWIVAHHVAGTPGVVNMSLGGPSDPAINSAVAGLTAAGLTVVVAAGNSNVDACGTSPASAPSALTVGAVDSSDARALFSTWGSNWGPCVDIFAPGVGIQSLAASHPGSVAVMSGTSMASPHVAGVAALYLAQYPTASPDQVASALLSAAQPVVLDAGAMTTNELVNSHVTPPGPGPVVGLAVTGATTSSLSISWSPPTSGTVPQSYQVAYRPVGGARVSGPVVVTTTATLTGLSPATSYEIDVTGTNAYGAGVVAGPVTASTAATPSAPQRLVASGSSFSSVALTWQAPTVPVGPVTGYVVEDSVDEVTWTTVATTAAGALSQTVSGLAPGTHHAFRVAAVTAAGRGDWSVPATSTVGLSKLVPLTPVRVLDTRSGVGAPVARPASGASVRLKVTGAAGVPASDVTAVMLNVTVTNARQAGYVQVMPSSGGVPGASSSVNVDRAGQTATNLVVVPVGVDGSVTMYDVAGGDLIADVVGYFTAVPSSNDGRYVGLKPTRVVDSRSGLGMPVVTGSGSYPRPSAGQVVTVDLAGVGGVPATGVSAVAMTVTATDSGGAGFVQVVPTGGTTSLGATSNVNLTAPGQTVANLVVSRLGQNGSVQIYTSSGTHLLVDVVGYVTDATRPSSSSGLFVALNPTRALDTRTSVAPLAGSQTLLSPRGTGGVPSSGVGAVFVNATVTQTAGPGYLQMFPTGNGVPGASSSLNFTAAGQTVANSVISGLGADGSATIDVSTATQVVIDVLGYFTQ